jgi:hypothetical protein
MGSSGNNRNDESANIEAVPAGVTNSEFPLEFPPPSDLTRNGNNNLQMATEFGAYAVAIASMLKLTS